MQKVSLEDATPSQLAEYAETILGLAGIDYRLGKDRILEKMRAAMYDKDFIELPAQEAPIQRIDPTPQVGGRRMAVINIHNQDKPGGTEPVPIAVNGKQMHVPRGQDCTIPWEYYHSLNNAKHYVYETDERLGLKPNPKEVHEYPFSVIRIDPPTQEWLDRENPPQKA